MAVRKSDCHFFYNKMKVSVILNTYNEKENYLTEAINSYIQQDCETEIIISTLSDDKNLGLIKSFPQVKIALLGKNLHPGKCPKGSFMQINNALPLITGEWFSFASSNDVAYKHKNSTEVQCCLKNDTLVCYSAFDVIDEMGNKTKTNFFHDYDFKKHLSGNFVSDCSLINVDMAKKFMPFDLSLNNYAYWHLWLSVFENEGNVFCYNSVPTWGYRNDKNSMHLNRTIEQIESFKQDRERMLNLHR